MSPCSAISIQHTDNIILRNLNIFLDCIPERIVVN